MIPFRFGFRALRAVGGAAVLAILVACSGAISTPGGISAYRRPPAELHALERFRPKEGVPCPPVEQTGGTRDLPGTPIGTIQPPPPRLSEQFHEEIVKADSLYEQQRYKEALTLLEPIYQAEPENQFVMDAYARTLFRLGERPRSFEVYSRLVSALDARRECKDQIVIDHWFTDAYWKKGIMHLHRREWQLAAFEISRAYAGMNEPMIIDQALSYLTEAFFNLGDYELASYYAQETLRHNPRNKYVLGTVDSMNRARNKCSKSCP
ncbi:MAG: tetratricopeptide repeat protein [Candidatus Binatia bacterium]